LGFLDLWLDEWVVRTVLLFFLLGGAVGQGLEVVADDVAVGSPEHKVRLQRVEEMAERLLAGVMLWLGRRSRAL